MRNNICPIKNDIHFILLYILVYDIRFVFCDICGVARKSRIPTQIILHIGSDFGHLQICNHSKSSENLISNLHGISNVIGKTIFIHPQSYFQDKYVLMSLAILCIVSIWHACVILVPIRTNMQNVTTSTNPVSMNASTAKEFQKKLESKSQFFKSYYNTIENPKTQVSESNDKVLVDPSKYDDAGEIILTTADIHFLRRIERDVLISFGALYIIAHCVFIFWLYFDVSFFYIC